MSSYEDFFYVSTTSRSTATATQAWLSKSKGPIVCLGEFHIRQGYGVVDVELETVRLGPGTMMIVFFAGLGLVRRKFLEAIGWEFVKENLHVGAVSDPTGKVSSEWVTFRGRQPIEVWGDQDTAARVCEYCGARIYSYDSPRFAKCLGRGLFEIYDDSGAGLLISSKRAKLKDLRQWKGVEVQTVAMVL